MSADGNYGVDLIRGGAYSPGVGSSLRPTVYSGAESAAQGKRRRRPARGAEQERRKAWGRMYGSINAAFWRQVREKERDT